MEHLWEEKEKCRLCHKVLKYDGNISGCDSDLCILYLLEQSINAIITIYL